MDIENQTEFLDDVEIEEELLKIQSIHECFNETNPLTYKVMLDANKHRLNQGQINYLEMMFKKYNTRQQKIYNKWHAYMTRNDKKTNEEIPENVVVELEKLRFDN